jgi:hypothetical protein
MRRYMEIIESAQRELATKIGYGTQTLDHPAVMYHMAMPNTRAQIAAEGLRRDRGETFEMGGAGAVFFYTHLAPEGRADVWEVNVADIPLELDETTDPSDPQDSWWCTYEHDIPPERLKLILKGAG